MLKLTLLDLNAQQTLGRLAAAGKNLKPLMQSIGESLQDSTRERFATGTAPDGQRWAPNTQTTIEQFLTKQSGNFGKDGKISKRGAARAINKKPLIGISKSLSQTINYDATANSVSIGSPMIYASVQQFGAAKGAFAGGKTPWGTIPARPFLGFSDQDQILIERLTITYISQLAD